MRTWPYAAPGCDAVHSIITPSDMQRDDRASRSGGRSRSPGTPRVLYGAQGPAWSGRTYESEWEDNANSARSLKRPLMLRAAAAFVIGTLGYLVPPVYSNGCPTVYLTRWILGILAFSLGMEKLTHLELFFWRIPSQGSGWLHKWADEANVTFLLQSDLSAE